MRFPEHYVEYMTDRYLKRCFAFALMLLMLCMAVIAPAEEMTEPDELSDIEEIAETDEADPEEETEPAEETEPEEMDKAQKESSGNESDFPPLNDDGFLDEGEFVCEDPENGLWRYCSETLKVEIIRRNENADVPTVWYEAEVWSRKETFGLITAYQGEHFRRTDWPEPVCAKRGAVLAVNGDFACGRWANMRYANKKYTVGIQIRDGEICNDRTQNSGSTAFPNMDTLALYPDGTMEVHDSKELTAEEYIERGATDVLSFGPWLLRDGQINECLEKFNKSRAPRTAVGMVEPGHWFAMMLEGRLKESKGGTIGYLAQKLKDRGCVNGFNLDGGETSCMLFMGKQINRVGGSHNRKGYARKAAEFLSIGTSALVEGYDPEAE